LLKPAKGQQRQENYKSVNKNKKPTNRGETSPSKLNLKKEIFSEDTNHSISVSAAPPNEHQRYNRARSQSHRASTVTFEKEYPDSETNSQQFSGGEKEKNKALKSLKN
jgi:hypothetical protein